MKGEKEVCRFLLESGASVNSTSDEGSTALMMACQGGNMELAEILLDKGADPTYQNRNGKSAIALIKNQAHRDRITRVVEKRK
jgi:ankyrin repeat protein